jgi:Zn-dependent oligopeptidase
MPKDFAIGLPSKENFEKIDQKGSTRLVIQKHNTVRSGGRSHYDMRLHNSKDNKTHSWVIKSLPGEKRRILAVRQPTHRAEYSDFQGLIPSGYGAGTVSKAYDKKVRVLSASNDRIKMILPEGTFTMIKPKSFSKNDKHWLMIKNAAYIDELEKIAGKNLYTNLKPFNKRNSKHNKKVLDLIKNLNEKRSKELEKNKKNPFDKLKGLEL